MLNPGTQDPVSRLIFELSKLPGVGEKTATRLAYHILKQENDYARSLSEALLEAKQKMGLCGTCFTFSDLDPCRICSNSQRDASSICVVERPSDILPMEQSGAHRGQYHVLHGVLSPLDGVGPEELKIKELIQRIHGRLQRGETPVQEIILATNPSVEGEATALYLTRLIRTSFGAGEAPIRVTQLAHGIPVGGMLEYTDRQTLGKAMQHRREVS